MFRTRPLSKRDQKKLASLSKRAQKLHARLMAGAWYRTYSKRSETAAMQELLDAGLAGYGGRCPQMVRCIVPKGYLHLSEWWMV